MRGGEEQEEAGRSLGQADGWEKPLHLKHAEIW
jgi:hypothetical protein